MDKKKFASVIAAAAAVAFVTAPLTSTLVQAASSKVKCYGVNSCKGKSACKTAQSACKGKNSCKGKGLMMKTEAQCKKLNGSTEEPTSEPTSK
ncbi:MAG TPA: hypothetical protein VNC84_06415 [Gammaproteobacteria bacterium]|jgi:uncharacterized membrane protein|nr:hypothetical protein [Gammaproteobacteria bacterium]